MGFCNTIYTFGKSLKLNSEHSLKVDDENSLYACVCVYSPILYLTLYCSFLYMLLIVNAIKYKYQRLSYLQQKRFHSKYIFKHIYYTKIFIKNKGTSTCQIQKGEPYKIKKINNSCGLRYKSFTNQKPSGVLTSKILPK